MGLSVVVYRFLLLRRCDFTYSASLLKKRMGVARFGDSASPIIEKTKIENDSVQLRFLKEATVCYIYSLCG